MRAASMNLWRCWAATSTVMGASMGSVSTLPPAKVEEFREPPPPPGVDLMKVTLSPVSEAVRAPTPPEVMVLRSSPL
jgi:hypothetical protein